MSRDRVQSQLQKIKDRAETPAKKIRKKRSIQF